MAGCLLTIQALGGAAMSFFTPTEASRGGAVIAWMRHKTSAYDSMKSHGSKENAGRFDGCLPSDLRNYWAGIGGEMRSGGLSAREGVDREMTGSLPLCPERV